MLLGEWVVGGPVSSARAEYVQGPSQELFCICSVTCLLDILEQLLIRKPVKGVRSSESGAGSNMGAISVQMLLRPVRSPRECIQSK